MPSPTIEFDTPRLAFRTWRPEHLEPFAALNADPEVMRHFPSTQTREQSAASIAAWNEQFEAQGYSNWAVLRRDTGAFVGFIGLTVPRRQLPFSPCVEIGWRLARAAWGQGFATEGARACLRLGFERFGLPEIVSFTAIENKASEAVMRRIGLVHAGADFEHPALPEGHRLRPHVLYKLARSVWLQRHPPT